MFCGILRVPSLNQLPRRDSNGNDSDNEKTGFSEQPETGGHPGGQFGNDSDSVARLRAQALDDLQRARKSLRRLEDLSDDPSESKAAGKAVKHVDAAFRELETSRV